MITVNISHNDAPEWIVEKFIDGIQRAGLTVTDVSKPEAPALIYTLQSNQILFVVYDTYTGNQAYFSSEKNAKTFSQKKSEGDDLEKGRFVIRGVHLDSESWQ